MAFSLTRSGSNVRLSLSRAGTLFETFRQHAGRSVEGVGQEVRLFVPTLVLALRNRDEAVRRAAAESLGDLGAEARVAITALRQAKLDQKGSVRQQANLALQKIHFAVRTANQQSFAWQHC